MTIEKTITKNGTTIYYRVDSKGKKTRIDGTLGAFEYARENKLGGYREEAQDVAIEAEENLANAHTAETENRDELQTLKAARDAAEKELDAKKAAFDAARKALETAEAELVDAYHKRNETFRAYKQQTPEPELDTDSPEYMLGIINELQTLNANAPDGWQVDFNPVENNFSVAFNGASVADIDSLVLAKILPPNKFFDRFKPIIDDDWDNYNREDRPHELWKEVV